MIGCTTDVPGILSSKGLASTDAARLTEFFRRFLFCFIIRVAGPDVVALRRLRYRPRMSAMGTDLSEMATEPGPQQAKSTRQSAELVGYGNGSVRVGVPEPQPPAVRGESPDKVEMYCLTCLGAIFPGGGIRGEISSNLS